MTLINNPFQYVPYMRPSNIPSMFQKSTTQQFQIFYSMTLANIPFCDRLKRSICSWTVHSVWQWHFSTSHSMMLTNTYNTFYYRSNILFHETSEQAILWHNPSFYHLKMPNFSFHDRLQHLNPFLDTCKQSNPWYASIPSMFQHSIPWHYPRPHSMTDSNILAATKQSVQWHNWTFHSMTLTNVPFHDSSLHSSPRDHQIFHSKRCYKIAIYDKWMQTCHSMMLNNIPLHDTSNYPFLTPSSILFWELPFDYTSQHYIPWHSQTLNFLRLMNIPLLDMSKHSIPSHLPTFHSIRLTNIPFHHT